MSERPRNKPAGKPPGQDPKDAAPGHLGKNDLGNVTWEWAREDDLMADDEVGTASRITALVDPNLDLTEDDEPTDNPLAVNPKRLKTGYNPYNSGALGKTSWKKKKDLKELSKWIELRKKMADKKPE